MPGVIAAIQTFGEQINLHPHLHFLVTEGGVDEAGIILKIPRIDDSRLATIFAREVLAGLVRKELLSPQCGGQMKVIAFLTDYSVVDRIINRLKLVFVAA